MFPITSRENKTLKLIRSLKRRKGRTETGLYFAEGVRLSREALAWAEDRVFCTLVSESFLEKEKELVASLDRGKFPVYAVRDGLFQEVCDTETPQGIGVALRMPQETEKSWEDKRFVLILDGVSEPGNLGTMVRTAEAAGVDCVCLLKGCADIWNPKAIRATMGSLFRVPLYTGMSPDFLRELQSAGFQVAAAALNDALPIDRAKLGPKRALVIGSEAAGVSREVLDRADCCVRIPMAGQVESLNAAVAAGIAMYALKP